MMKSWSGTRTELNYFDKLTEVRNFTSGLTECTGDGDYICITSGENGFEGLTSGRTSRAAPSQLKIFFFFNVTTADPGIAKVDLFTQRSTIEFGLTGLVT